MTAARWQSVFVPNWATWDLVVEAAQLAAYELAVMCDGLEGLGPVTYQVAKAPQQDDLAGMVLLVAWRDSVPAMAGR